MPTYLYAENVSPRDRFGQLELSLDNGDTAILNRGNAYALSASEVTRARRYVVMLDTAALAVAPQIIARLPIQGSPVDGDVPIWNSAAAAFIPGVVTGGGGGGTTSPRTLTFSQLTGSLTTSFPWRAPEALTLVRATVSTETAVGSTAVIVAVRVNGTSVASLSVSAGQTSATSAVSIPISADALVTVSRISVEGGAVQVQLDTVGDATPVSSPGAVTRPIPVTTAYGFEPSES